MQGLGEIIIANARAGGWQRPPHVRSQTSPRPPRDCGKFGSVGANGEGTPWLVKRIRRATSEAPGWFHVVLVSSGEILAEYQKIKHARKHVARLILGSAS